MTHMPPARRDATVLLQAWRHGDRAAFDQLVPLVHNELRRLARHQMRGERPDHTLQATALVNEAYVRLVDLNQIEWNDRAHFFAMAARVMRRFLVDSARARRYQKRGGGAPKVSLDDAVAVSSDPGLDLVALVDALKTLAAMDPRKGEVVEMRFFGGLTVEEIATALQISAATVMRDWRLA
jgi:RNA polymerase sigma factor (TIGR02999 family)